MSKGLPLEVEFLHREREPIIQQWRDELESSVNRHLFTEGIGFSTPFIAQVFDDIVNAIHRNLYRNLNVTFDTLLKNGRLPALPIRDVREFIFQFVPAARTVLKRLYPEGGSGQAEIIFQRLKVIERDLRGVYSERLARNLLTLLDQQRDHILETWLEALPTPIVSDHFSVLDVSDRRLFLSNTLDLLVTMLRGEDQEMIPGTGDVPPRTRLQNYLFGVVEFYEPKGFIISDLQRALNYPIRLIEPRLYQKLHHSAAEYRVALLSLIDVLQTLTQTFSEAYNERQMKNYYNEVSIMLHRIKNKLTAVPTTMETILMIPKDESEMAGDPMVVTTQESEIFNAWLEKTDALIAAVREAVDPSEDDEEKLIRSQRGSRDAVATLTTIADAWREYQAGILEDQAAMDNIRYKLEVGSIEILNELLGIVYEGGKLTAELTLELQLRQNELYQREPPVRRELDIYNMVRKAFEESVAEAHSRSIEYELIAEDRGVHVFGVEAELKRPFIQMIENAIKYTPVGGNVTVELDYEPDHILFAVKDTGIGIPPGEEELVFGLCERCSNAKDFNKAGTGTGLYNDRKIILHHNGQIWVESEGAEKGSTFFIRIPIHRRHRDGADAERRDAAPVVPDGPAISGTSLTPGP